VDTGYTVASGGKVIGARGTGYQFLNTVTSSVTPSTASPEDYVYLDGTFNILGKQLGALGNSWRGEDPADIFRLGRQFNNGKNHIPGWINGAFDTVSDPDVIFNYADTLSTYEFTESTNEMVATAIELHAYRDAQLGGAQVQFPQGVLNMTNDTTSNGSGIVIEANSTNSSNASANETNNSSINQTNSTVDSNSSNSSSPFLNVTIPELNTSSSQANATPALNQTNSTIPLNNTTNATTDTANTTSASNQTSESTGSSSGGGSGSGGGGGGSSGSKQGSQNKESERNKFGANRDQIYGVTMFETQNFEVVYAVLGRDKINSTQVQNITLDAKVSSGNITRAEAVFLNSLGEYRAENLTLIAGTGSYGTWSADFGGFANGLQQLEVVRLWGRSASPAEIRIPNRAFYVTDGNETFEENHLRLVYTTLDASNLEPGQNATLRIDAGDNGGITGVAAKIESSRGGSFNLSLQRVRGNQFYGTWEEVIVANQSDSTYVVTQITLFNATDEKNYTIEGRSVYVAAVPPAIGKLASRAVETVKVFSRRWVLQVIQKPLVPTLIAFGIMTIAISLLLAGGKIRRWMGKVTA
ncbi:MAG TPA: hypothetical protein VJJ82_00980, partial [Candidatus Nanoarchaeia archaeon]|nr:hypothetical protein [Candidatus Nanoarchaeia archaeon]